MCLSLTCLSSRACALLFTSVDVLSMHSKWSSLALFACQTYLPFHLQWSTTFCKFVSFNYNCSINSQFIAFCTNMNKLTLATTCTKHIFRFTEFRERERKKRKRKKGVGWLTQSVIFEEINRHRKDIFIRAQSTLNSRLASRVGNDLIEPSLPVLIQMSMSWLSRYCKGLMMWYMVLPPPM